MHIFAVNAFRKACGFSDMITTALRPFSMIVYCGFSDDREEQFYKKKLQLKHNNEGVVKPKYAELTQTMQRGNMRV